MLDISETKDYKKARVSLGLADKLIGNDSGVAEKVKKDREELEMLENLKTLHKKDFLGEKYVYKYF